jgi:hypothetical protein
MPGARRTRSLVCAWGSKKCTRVFTARSPKSSGIPTQWFTAYSALSSVTGLSCHRRLAGLTAKLDASVGASGPHAFAVRLKRIRQSAIRVHRIPPRVRDDREPPLRWDGTAAISEVIWVGRKEKIFGGGGWTGRIRLSRLNNFYFARTAPVRLRQQSGERNLTRRRIIVSELAHRKPLIRVRLPGPSGRVRRHADGTFLGWKHAFIQRACLLNKYGLVAFRIGPRKWYHFAHWICRL